MGTCLSCGQRAKTISDRIGFCVSCIRNYWPEIEPAIKKIHASTRKAFGLPEFPPKAEGGLPCNLCFHRCRIPEGAFGYCGVWQNRQGRLIGPGPEEAFVSWYLDPLPTNCVADFVCAGGTGAGFPQFAYQAGPERGYFNLAVFYEACNFNCLYCQNWHFRKRSLHSRGHASAQMLSDLKPQVSCICYFGGDPGPQTPHALAFSKRALEKASGRILRICWETNGAENPRIIRQMMNLSLKSGGVLKVDLKAFSFSVHFTLCGVSNQATLENFKLLAELASLRPVPSSLVASTLLVPGYVDEEEVAALARFISDLDPEIPWSLLAFYPTFYLDDLPPTSLRHAQAALSAARSAGLKKVHLGNTHLLGDNY